MLVLSIEEAVKCLVLIAKFFEIEVPESAVKVFYDHKYKHGQGKEIQPLLSTIQWISDNINALKSKSKNLVIELGILFLLPNILDRIFKVNDTQRDWWLSANDLKNNGLYVSFVDDAWKTPKAIDSSTFNSTLEIARSFVEILAVIEKLQPEDHRVITGGQFNEDLRSTNDKL
ncbi:AbiV family abortive infection protein [Marinoscillum furvescens DSM 4134]|uniref:AbiV family abortive infection protein n=2 Tax=Marinoscillum furvescens TaxID=1026 RepID=A0A3D9L2F1_MARFU|nr:AbiV family abortive infection protein [Marinoscillum furvescens DSM 4134]